IPAAVVAAFLGSLGVASASNNTADGPAIVKAVAPEYPRAAERRQIEGVVTVSIDINDTGAVTSVSVVSADPAGIFDTAAIKAVEKWKFETGQASTGILKNIRFKLEG
ncbi:MAG: energy transducer TonB, partial [Planctomycetota bacterium]